MAMSLLYAINTRIDIALLGAFHTNPAEIAHYNAALKFSDLLQIPFMGIVAVVTPMFARLFAEKQQQQLQSLYLLSTRIMFGLTAVGCLLFWVLGEWLLTWFGDSFRNGYSCLVFLLIARLMHAFVGPANYLLLMSEQQKSVTYTILFSTLATLALHCICIPLWGIQGAAYATAGGAVVFEAGMVWLVWRRLGVRAGVV